MKPTTFRLTLCALLIFGVTAKPYIPLEKLSNEETQETVSKYDTKKEHVGVEVGPKDVNPSFNTWKSMAAEQYEGPLKDEEVREVVDADSVFTEVSSEDPEQDWDQVYHKDIERVLQYLAPLSGNYRANADVRPLYSEPEKDEDEVYHGDKRYSEVQTESEQEAREAGAVRVHLQPEEDEDDLYHKDDRQLLFQSDPRAAAPVDVPSQRKHSEPEEDLDDLYHR